MSQTRVTITEQHATTRLTVSPLGLQGAPGSAVFTADEIAAVQGANAPDAGNPFATMADIVPGGVSADAGNLLIAGTDDLPYASATEITPAAIGAATTAQGGLADSAVQPGDLGTAAALDVGTDALDVVQLDASAKLPAVDGSQLTNLPGGVSDHGALSGLTDDDHTQYPLLAGRATGQTIIGGTAVGDAITLQGTSGNGTASVAAIVAKVGNNGATTAITVLNNGDVGIGVAVPSAKLHVVKTTEQLRLGYDAANYASFAIDSSGQLKIANTGTVVAIGKSAGVALTTGTEDVFIGSEAGRVNSTGKNNAFAGFQAGYSNTTGSNISAFGNSAGYNNTTGGSNQYFGNAAGYNTTTSGFNTFVGSLAGFGNVAGGSNVFLGYLAGRYHANGSTALTDPENSIYIGAICRGKDNSDSNSIVIGYAAIGLGANTTVIGNSSTTQTHLFGALNVGPDTPAHTLHVSNGTTATDFGLYNTKTDDSNYERLSIGWAGNVCTIAPEAAGTGTLRGLNIGAAASLVGLFGVTPVVQPASAAQAVVTLGNTDSEIGGLTISAAYDQTEVQALRDKCEELADDVRALSTLVHSLRTALVNLGAIKGAA